MRYVGGDAREPLGVEILDVGHDVACTVVGTALQLQLVIWTTYSKHHFVGESVFKSLRKFKHVFVDLWELLHQKNNQELGGDVVDSLDVAGFGVPHIPDEEESYK